MGHFLIFIPFSSHIQSEVVPYNVWAFRGESHRMAGAPPEIELGGATRRPVRACVEI